MAKRKKDVAALKRLGRRIKALRKEQKMADGKELSQAQLAFEAGVSRATVNRLEMGLYDPKLSTLIAIAKVLRVDIKELL
jgi:DNA-binding XRE family transcriptional regulator